MQRRTFVLTSGSAALAARAAAGANSRINVAIVGLGCRGRELLDLVLGAPGFRVVAVCDADPERAAHAAAVASHAQGSLPAACRDYRLVLEDNQVDAVVLATPDCWHALGVIRACQAGKDVYCESPASHNLWEGRKMVEAARKYGRIVQVGIQTRSLEHMIRAVHLLREGVIGRLHMAKGFASPGPPENRPSGQDWRCRWDTGNGAIGSLGAQGLDICRWGLDKSTLPVSVFSCGVPVPPANHREPPGAQLAVFEYGDCQVHFEVRAHMADAGAGAEFFGSDGYLCLNAEGFQVFRYGHRRPALSVKSSGARPGDAAPHLANFLHAVGSRRPSDLNCDIEQGRLSAAMGHMANASCRLGRKLVFDPVAENYGSDYEANLLLARDHRSPLAVPETL